MQLSLETLYQFEVFFFSPFHKEDATVAMKPKKSWQYWFVLTQPLTYLETRDSVVYALGVRDLPVPFDFKTSHFGCVHGGNVE